MSEKECSLHEDKKCMLHKDKKHKLLRRIFAGIVITLIIILIIVLIIWAILQPKNPQFSLQDATVNSFNITAPNFLTSVIQITISSRNPNHQIGVYYDKLDVYATYQNQQITYHTSIPPTYQGHMTDNVWSPFVCGTTVPVAPYNGVALSQDEACGTVNLLFKIDGRVRFKVGTFISAQYHLFVKCPAVIPFGCRSTGVVVGDAVKYQMFHSCSVTVSV